MAAARQHAQLGLRVCQQLPVEIETVLDRVAVLAQLLDFGDRDLEGAHPAAELPLTISNRARTAAHCS